MLSEIVPEEFADALDDVVAEVLSAAGWHAPPVDCVQIARRLGLEVAFDSRLAGRGRIVRLGHRGAGTGQESILLRPEPRAERIQWAVGHEIGEKFARDVFAGLGVDAREAPRGARESVANHLAGRLLLPSLWFANDAQACDWDLPALKRRYSTASHELVARRMLDCQPSIVITVFDNDRQTFRRASGSGRRPPLAPAEIECRRRVVEQLCGQIVTEPGYRVQGWPIHEAQWCREILRTEREETWDDSDPA